MEHLFLGSCGFDLIVWINNVFQYFQYYGVPVGSATCHFLVLYHQKMWIL